MREYGIARKTAPLPELTGRLFDPEMDDFCVGADYAPIDSYVWDATGYRPEARAYAVHDAQGLWILMCAQEAEICAQVEEFNGEVYQDSCLECFLQPIEGDPRYLNVEVNPLGTALIGVGAGRFDRTRLQAMPGDMEMQASRHRGGWWAVRYRISWRLIANLFGRAPEPGTAMRGNFYKCDESIHPHFGSWAPVVNFRPDFHLPQWFGRLRLL